MVKFNATWSFLLLAIFANHAFAMHSPSEPLMVRAEAFYKTDRSLAFEYWLAAYKQGNVQAIVNLGHLKTEGFGQRPDYYQANVYFYLASQQDEPTATYNLASNYLNGFGAPKSRYQAFQLFKRAAALGQKDAKKTLRDVFHNLEPLVDLATPFDFKNSYYVAPEECGNIEVFEVDELPSEKSKDS